MKKTLIFSLCLSLIFCSACQNTARNEAQPTPDQSNTAEIKTIPSPPDNQAVKTFQGDRAYFESGIYNTALVHSVPIDSVMLIGEYTIKPENPQALSDLPGVTPEMAADFWEANKEPAKIKNSFDVYATIKMIRIKDSITATLKSAKEKYPKAAGIILLSRAGLNRTGDEQVIYTEFYDFAGGVKKRFCITSDSKVNEPNWVTVP